MYGEKSTGLGLPSTHLNDTCPAHRSCMCAAVRWFRPRTLQRTVQRPNDMSALPNRCVELVGLQAAGPPLAARVMRTDPACITMPVTWCPCVSAPTQVSKYYHNILVPCHAPGSSKGNTSNAPTAQILLTVQRRLTLLRCRQALYLDILRGRARAPSAPSSGPRAAPATGRPPPAGPALLTPEEVHITSWAEGARGLGFRGKYTAAGGQQDTYRKATAFEALVGGASGT